MLGDFTNDESKNEDTGVGEKDGGIVPTIGAGSLGGVIAGSNPDSSQNSGSPPVTGGGSGAVAPYNPSYNINQQSGNEEASPLPLNPNAYTNPYLGGQMGAIGNQEIQLQSQAMNPYTMQAAQAGNMNMNMGPQRQTAAQQGYLAQMLMRQANGTGPSAAQSQLAQGAGNNINAQLAMAAGGTNPGLSRYQAAQNIGNLNQQAAAQAATLKAQEMQSGQQALVGALGTQRGQDIGASSQQAQIANQGAQFNAGLNQQANQANLGAQIQQQQFVDQETQKLMAMGFTLQQAQFQANQAYAQQAQNANVQQYNIATGANIAQGNQNAQMAGAGIGAGGAVVGAGITSGLFSALANS